MKKIRAISALCLIFCLTIQVFLLSGCEDDDKDKTEEPVTTSITLTLTNYKTYLGIKLSSIIYTPQGSGNTYTANWTIETYSMSNKYEFVDVSITIRGTEKTVTNEGYTSHSGNTPYVFNTWIPTLTVNSIQGEVVTIN